MKTEKLCPVLQTGIVDLKLNINREDAEKFYQAIQESFRRIIEAFIIPAEIIGPYIKHEYNGRLKYQRRIRFGRHRRNRRR